MATHAMIDLETMGVEPRSKILTIGAVKFDPWHPGKGVWDEFYTRLDISAQEALGRTETPSTMDWWGRQEPAIIEEAFTDQDRLDPAGVMGALKQWFVGCDKIWSQGIAFDIVMLEDLCRQVSQPIAWQFYEVEDCRTILNRMTYDPRKGQNKAAHNALEDSRTQARALQEAFKHFEFKR